MIDAVSNVSLALAEITKLIYGELHPSQQAQIKEAYEESVTRVNQYMEALLSDDVDTQRRLELGIMSGIPASIGPGQIDKLEREPAIGFNKFNQLGWYQRAEGTQPWTKKMKHQAK